MGIVIKELRLPARSIAKEFNKGGFTMIDLASIGILHLGNYDAMDMFELVKIINSPEFQSSSPKEIVSRALTRSKAQKRKSVRNTSK